MQYRRLILLTHTEQLVDIFEPQKARVCLNFEDFRRFDQKLFHS